MAEADWTIEKARSYFVNPSGGDTTRLAMLAAYSTSAMGEIYAGRPFEGLLDQMPEDDISSVVKELLRRESRTRIFNHKFMGQIHPQGNEVAIIAKLVAGFMNTNTIVKEVSMSEHGMEFEVLDWLAELFGYEIDSYSGNMVTGGTSANEAALWVAREKMIKNWKLREGANYRMRDRILVMASEMTHYSVEKACHKLGENIHVETVGTNDYCTDVEDMERKLELHTIAGVPIMAIVGVAGETETGMVDNLYRMAQLANKFGIHYHVDAAYGGPYKLVSPELFRGIDMADSIAVDPHKMLYTPYPSAAVLFRNKEDHALIEKGARYLQKKENAGILGPRESRNFGLAARPEGSMGADSVLMAWATLQLFGEAGIRTLLRHTTTLTMIAYDKVTTSESFDPMHIPHTNTLLVRANPDIYNHVTDEAMHAIQQELERKHGYYISVNEGVNGGQSAFRLVFMHPWTTPFDVLDMLDKLEEIMKEKLS